MQNDFFNLTSFLRSLSAYPWWQIALELLIIGGVVYWVMRFLRGTRGARLLRGIALVLIILYLVIRFLATTLGLDRIDFLYGKFLSIASIAVIVVFQPELRRALMRLGETRLFRTWTSQVHEEIDELVEAASFCAKRKIGALIAIEREVGLGGIADSGTRINADLSAALLNTIFWPNSPLHDLGVVISQGKIAFAGVQFPLAEEGTLERELGSRHRAAVGLSNESDAVVLVVSEETGDVSIAERGVLMRKLTPDALRGLLTELLGATERKAGDIREAA
jgi:diadenylate cyclase